MKWLRVLLLVTCATSLAAAGDSEFRGVVRAIESTYGVHHIRIPFLGVAMFFARPEGVSGLKLAVFEDFKGSAETRDLNHLIEGSLGPAWYPFVRVRSHADGETTLIYANPEGGKLRMMIVNIEAAEATVVELKLSERAIKGWLKEPGEKAEDQSGQRRHHSDD